MTYRELLSQPREGHELTCVSNERGIHWCIRCGALWLDASHGRPDAGWETPSPAGDSRPSKEAPPCLPMSTAGAVNPAGDARLMLHALTHGWRCEPVTLPAVHDFEAWRWSRDGLLGGGAWTVIGRWSEGPVVDDTVRRELLTTSDNLRIAVRS